MADPIERVKPGDLITHVLMNSIIDKLESLQAKVAALEAAGPGDGTVAITGFTYTEPLRVGDILTVNGRNFSVPAENNIVTVGGARVGFFRFGSADDRLIFDVPEVTGLDPQGSPVTVSVTNPNGNASDDVNLRPRQVVPRGRLEIVYSDPPVMPFDNPNIREGTYIFGFSLTAFVDREATYTLTPTITGTGSWGVQLLQSDSDQPRDSNEITIPGNVSGVQRTIRVRVTVPNLPNGTTGTLSLGVTENTADSQVSPGNATIEITVGQPPPTPETRVRVTLRRADLSARISGNKVQFPRNNEPGRIAFTILFAEGGTYRVAASVKNPSGWSAPEIDTQTLEVTPPSPGSTTNQNVNVLLQASDTAADTDMVFSVTRGTEISVRYFLGLTTVAS